MLTNRDRILSVAVSETRNLANVRGIIDIDAERISRNFYHDEESSLGDIMDYHSISALQGVDLPYRDSVNTRKTSSLEKYKPFSVDWRFLPDPILLAKDYVRYHLANASNSIANTPKLRKLWVKTLGRGPLKAVQSAEMLFIHAPKTGGTSVSKVLYGKNLPPYSVEFWLKVFGSAVYNIKSFSIVRHPVDRVLSVYKMALNGGTDIMAYSRFSQYNLKGLESFDSFIDNIANQISDGSVLPLELQNQSALILSREGKILVDRLFALDSQRGFPRELTRWLSVEKLPHLNAANPNLVAISKETRNKILEIYARDLAIYDILASKGGFADLKGVRLGER